MTNNSSHKTEKNPGQDPKPLTQGELRKKRLAEQLRNNLRNRKTQARERRNFDKQSDE